MIVREEKKSHYTIIDNSILQNKNISNHAFCLLTRLMSLPPKWNLNFWDIFRYSNTGKGTCRKAVSELVSMGYFEPVPYRDQRGQYAGLHYNIHEKPCNPQTADFDTVNPRTDLRYTVKWYGNKSNIYIKEKQTLEQEATYNAVVCSDKKIRVQETITPVQETITLVQETIIPVQVTPVQETPVKVAPIQVAQEQKPITQEQKSENQKQLNRTFLRNKIRLEMDRNSLNRTRTPEVKNSFGIEQVSNSLDSMMESLKNNVAEQQIQLTSNQPITKESKPIEHVRQVTPVNVTPKKPITEKDLEELSKLSKESSSDVKKLLWRFRFESCEYIRAQIEYSNKHSKTNFPGYLNDSLTKDYAGFNKKQAEIKEKETKKIEAERKKKEEEAKNHTVMEQMREKALSIFRRLPGTVQQGIKNIFDKNALIPYHDDESFLDYLEFQFKKFGEQWFFVTG